MLTDAVVAEGMAGGAALRVLYIHGFTRLGGAEHALLRLADAIRQMGIEPLVLWPRNDRAFAWLRSRGIRAAGIKVPVGTRRLSLLVFPLMLARVLRFVAPAKIDLVHVNNYRSVHFGRMVSRWTKVPLVCHVRELITPKKMRQYRLRASDALIAVSGAVADALIGGGMPADRVTTIRSGIPLIGTLREGEGPAVRDGLGILQDDPVVGIIAHILPHKGFDDLIRALALIQKKHPRVRCLVVGEAPRKRYLQELLDLAERLSVRDRLVLVGFQDEVAPLLNAMDLFILPSHTEGLPITILEAMAAGRPVVATSVGGIPEVVRDGETGILIRSRDPEGLAEAVIRLLESPRLARAMGEEGRKRVEALFTMEAEAERTAMVYRQVLAASPAALL